MIYKIGVEGMRQCEICKIIKLDRNDINKTNLVFCISFLATEKIASTN